MNNYSLKRVGKFYKSGCPSHPYIYHALLQTAFGLCNELEGLIRRFWWGQRGDQRNIHWVRWEELCKPKSEGGMGFKDLALFNDALLANQALRLLQNKNSLLYRVFKPKFFPNCLFMEVSESQVSSYAWRSILKGREVLKEGMRWRVGNGSSISIWTDPWLPSTFLPFISSPMVLGWEEATVTSLLDDSSLGWKQDTLNLLFSQRDKELINSILLCGKLVEDVLMWPFTPTESYTVKLGYRFLYNSRTLDNGEYQPDDNRLWRKVWGMQVQPKVRNFLWRATKNSIPTKQNLRRRMFLTDDGCDHCHSEPEDVLHALWTCPSISRVWTQTSLWENSDPSPRFSCFKDLVETIVETGKDLNLFAITTWAIWNRRNTMRTSGTHVPVQQVHYEVQKARSTFI